MEKRVHGVEETCLKLIGLGCESESINKDWESTVQNINWQEDCGWDLRWERKDVETWPNEMGLRPINWNLMTC